VRDLLADGLRCRHAGHDTTVLNFQDIGNMERGFLTS
jgi:hypothetical protein